MTSRRVGGRNSSTKPMSLENLFSTLPTGLASKKVIGAWRTEKRSRLWSVSDDVEQMLKKLCVTRMAKIKEPKRRMRYM